MISETIVDKIIEDLTDRRGLRQEWEQLDEEIQQEIRQSWIELVDVALADDGLDNHR